MQVARFYGCGHQAGGRRAEEEADLLAKRLAPVPPVAEPTDSRSLPFPPETSSTRTFAPAHRGQFASGPETTHCYPGTLPTARPHAFAYRAVLADVLRALDVLTAQPEAMSWPIGVYGDDLGVIVAARGPAVRAARVDSALLPQWSASLG